MLNDTERRQWANLSTIITAANNQLQAIVGSLSKRGAVDDIQELRDTMMDLATLSFDIKVRHQVHEAEAEKEYQQQNSRHVYQCASCQDTMVYIGLPENVAICHGVAMAPLRVEPPMYPRGNY